MNTEIITGTDPEALADLEAVMKQINDGTPLPPEIARRIDERAARIKDDLRRNYGEIDVVQLLRDARDES